MIYDVLLLSLHFQYFFIFKYYYKGKQYSNSSES